MMVMNLISASKLKVKAVVTQESAVPEEGRSYLNTLKLEVPRKAEKEVHTAGNTKYFELRCDAHPHITK